MHEGDCCVCAYEREREVSGSGHSLTISVTASFYKVLFVLHLWNAGQEIKMYGWVKHVKGMLSLWEGRVAGCSYWITILNALTSKEAVSRQSLQKDLHFRISRHVLIQQIQVIYLSDFPVLGRTPWLDCVSNPYRHVCLAGISSLEPLSGVSPAWWMGHENLCFVCAFDQQSSGNRQCDWLTPCQVSGRRSRSEVTQVTRISNNLSLQMSCSLGNLTNYTV